MALPVGFEVGQRPGDLIMPLEEHLLERVRERRSHTRFLVECIFTLLLASLLWAASHPSQMANMLGARYDHQFWAAATYVWFPFVVYALVGLTLLTMIYYGTSFQITPFRILLPFVKGSPFSIRLSESIGRRGSVDESGESEKSLATLAALEAERAELQRVVSENRAAAEPAVHHADPVDFIDFILMRAATAAEELAEKMENRINLHLTFGVLTGGVGLAVWYMTFYRPGTAKVMETTLTGRALDVLPRITILFFIEVLAGFFLRQYRIGVEDLKYFLELWRRADAKRIAYTIFERVNDTQAKLDFAKQLLSERSDSRLSKDEMTTTLYAIEKERNEFINGIESLAKQLGTAAAEIKQEKK
jgi:hypothetical protein